MDCAAQCLGFVPWHVCLEGVDTVDANVTVAWSGHGSTMDRETVKILRRAVLDSDRGRHGPPGADDGEVTQCRYPLDAALDERAHAFFLDVFNPAGQAVLPRGAPHPGPVVHASHPAAYGKRDRELVCRLFRET